MNADGTNDGATRRDLLKKAAAAGVVVWTTPQVLANSASAATSTGDFDWCQIFPHLPQCQATTTTSTTTTTTQPTTTTTTPPPGGKTVCGSVRYSKYRRIKWHFDSGGGSRVSAGSFRSTNAYDTVCITAGALKCGNSPLSISTVMDDSSLDNPGNAPSSMNHRFTEVSADVSGNTKRWQIHPPAGWTIVAASGKAYKSGGGDTRCFKVDVDAGLNWGNSNVDATDGTTYQILANGDFFAEGKPHWVELVIAQ
jgi:hypothetical protein